MTFIKKMVLHGFKSFAKKTEIPFDRGINVVIGANGSGKCIKGDSVVQMANGSLTRIDELVNNRLGQEGVAKTEDGWIAGENGQEVMCLDMESLKIRSKKIKGFVKKTAPKEMLRIKTKSGREIVSTKYHPFFILKEGEVVAAKAEELSERTRIAVPRKIQIENNKYMEELIDMIGFEDNVYVPYREEYENILRGIKGDKTWKEISEILGFSEYVIGGLVDKQSINFFYLVKILKYAGLSNKQIIDIIPEIVSNGNKIKFSFVNSPEFCRFLGYLFAEGRLSSDNDQIWFTNGSIEVVEDFVMLVKKLFNKNPMVREYKPRCWDVIICSMPLQRILRKLGMASKTEKKHISNVLLKHSNNEEIGNLLGGMYSGDGYVGKSVIDIVTKSERLRDGIENCLIRLGINYSRRKVIKRIKSTGFSGEYWALSSYGVQSFAKFNELVNIKHRNKRERIQNGLSKKCNPNTDLIEASDVVREIVKEQGINVKGMRDKYPILSSYCYNGCTPSRHGLGVLVQEVFQEQGIHMKQLQKLAFSDIYWDEISEIEEVGGIDWVYDLTIEKDHNFLANNIIVHNSNISDGLCFALGRLSMKSMRTTKAKNLLFMGSKYIKPAHEASVEIVFDNSQRTFGVDKDEVVLKRIVRHNGQGIYKINDETKTRSEVIELLAHAGIDPHGFNIVLQGGIQSIVKMHPEDRRKIIEEVAGISIYESRKEKSLKELEKTEQKMKEVSAVLRERTAYMKNLDKERAQALRAQELQLTEKRCKASILCKKADEKQREIEHLVKSLEKGMAQRDEIRAIYESEQREIESLSQRINLINKHIQDSTGLEQDKLNNEVANLKAELEGLRVRREGQENRKAEVERRIAEVSKTIPEIEAQIAELKKKSPMMAKKAQELKKKRDELNQIGEERKRLLTLKTELGSIKERIKDRENQIAGIKSQSESALKQLESYSENIQYKDSEECHKEMNKIKEAAKEIHEHINMLNKAEMENEKLTSVFESEIKNAMRVKADIQKIDICPLCQSKMTEEHVSHVTKSSDDKIIKAKEETDRINAELEKAKGERDELVIKLRECDSKISSGEVEMMKHKAINNIKHQIGKFVENEKLLGEEITKLGERRVYLESKSTDLGEIEEKYNSRLLEIEEISSRTEENTDQTILYRERDLEATHNIIKRSKQDEEDIAVAIKELSSLFKSREETLKIKDEQVEKLNQKFRKMFSDRDNLQAMIQEKNVNMADVQSNIRDAEEQINSLKIAKARLDAEKETFDIGLQEFAGIEIIPGSMNMIEERLVKAQESLKMIGSINMRALEVYEEVKKEYDIVAEKVETLNREKDEIMKIVSEIDLRKRREFMRTFREINERFTQNFAKLYTKGVAYLEVENKEDIFKGGANIVVKLAKGKYFDVTSLSGGEQTLVALSLLFAIQEYKPYHFYIFDEIDAALDKRNSERLAALLKQYMTGGQYIVVTHNDAIITDSNVLYGVSMHEGVSKVLSIKLKGEAPSMAEKPEILEETNSSPVNTMESNNS